MFDKNANLFQQIDHTADVGIICRGNSLPQLFANAAYGMISLIYGLINTENESKKSFKITAADLEELLVSWLSEINFLLTTQYFLVSMIENIEIIETKSGFTLNAVLLGTDSRLFIELAETEIKAVTYHQLKIEQDESGYRAQIIFDI